MFACELQMSVGGEGTDSHQLALPSPSLPNQPTESTDAYNTI